MEEYVDNQEPSSNDTSRSAAERPVVPDGETVTVRLTDSLRDSHEVMGTLQDVGGVLEFPSPAAATAFTDALNELSDPDYILTPDHHGTTTNFYMRFESRKANR